MSVSVDEQYDLPLLLTWGGILMDKSKRQNERDGYSYTTYISGFTLLSHYTPDGLNFALFDSVKQDITEIPTLIVAVEVDHLCPSTDVNDATLILLLSVV